MRAGGPEGTDRSFGGGRWLNPQVTIVAGRRGKGSGMSRRMLIGATAVAALLSMMICGAAFAAEVSRDEYKEAAEPICKTSTKANERILDGVPKEVKAGKLKAPAAKFTRASKVQAKALRELEALPQPTADEARLGSWLGYLKSEGELFATAGKKLKAGNKVAADHIINKLSRVAGKANVQVLPFSFRYCRQEPSKFIAA
jgi:hypothetical protein